MPQIVTAEKPGRKTRKKPSAFEKLWARAKKLKVENQKLSAELEKTISRLRETVLPQELAVAQAQKPLLIKLLKMGQRKSMTQWERQVLDEWIRETLEDFHQYNLIDTDLLNHLALYDSFRMGISLEDNDIAPHQQFVEIVQQAEAERQEQQRQEEQAEVDSIKEFREQLKTHGHADIEDELDRILGPRPRIEENKTPDLWEDDLSELQRQQQIQYDAEREALREKLIDDLLREIDLITGDNLADALADNQADEESFEDFLSDSFDSEDLDSLISNKEETTPELTDKTFQRLFRATAARLHPDREPDPDLRLEKQTLMASLLKARKGGDLLTVLELYESWVGEHDGFSTADKKSLQHTLQKWISNLELEQEDIIMQSPLHFRAFNVYHSESQQKVSRIISQRMKELQQSEDMIEVMNDQITSLKTLKPFLEERYERKYTMSYSYSEA